MVTRMLSLSMGTTLFTSPSWRALKIAQPGRTGSQAGEEEEAPGLAADGGEIVVSAGDQHHEPGEHQHHNGAQGCGYVGIGLFDAAFG